MILINQESIAIITYILYKFCSIKVILFLSISIALANTLNWISVKSSIERRYPNTPTISILTLQQWLQDSITLHLVDVRSFSEFKISHLKNALFLATISKIKQKFPNKNSLIILYCSVGIRSAKLVYQLQKERYQNIYNLEGSIFEWAKQDLPIYQNKSLIKKVHPYNKYWSTLLKKEYHP